MVKFQNSIVFKVVVIIIVLQSIIWFWITSTIKSHENQLLKTLNKQQKEFVVNFVEDQKRKTKEKILQNLRRIVDFSQATLSYSLYNYETKSAKKIISDVLLEDPNIKGVIVFDSVTKSVFIAGYKDKKGNKIFTKTLLPEDFKSYQFIKKELIYNNEPIGHIKIYYDIKPALKHLDKMMKNELNIVNIKFNQIYTATKEKEKKLFLYFLIAALLTIVIIVFTLTKFINKPLNEIRKGLERFFDFLANPKNEIEPININSKDEFGEIAEFTNKGIAVSSKLHRELAELLDVIDKNVMICEFDEYGNVIDVTQAFIQICGYTEEEISKKRKQVLCNVDLKQIIEHIEIYGNWRGEVKCKAKNGKELWLSSNITKKCTFENGECRYINILYNITDKKELEQLKNHLEELVEEKTSKIKALLNMTKESIRYASLIQKSILPPPQIFDKAFSDYFVIWEPKDVLGGDIYFLDEVRKDEYLLMLVDCTGHGVHGALMTMLVKAIQLNIINELSHSNKPISPSEILSKFNVSIKAILKQYSKDSASNAGFDGAILYYNKKDKTIKFASANVPMFYLEDEEIHYIRGDKRSVGDIFTELDYKYHEYDIPLSEKTKFYLTTDGFLDQIGGEKELPFGKERFKELILKYHNLDFKTQKELFIEELLKYQGSQPRTDDIAVVAFKP